MFMGGRSRPPLMRAAAELFLKLITRSDESSSSTSQSCDICERLKEHEQSACAELGLGVNQNVFARWLISDGAPCVPHARIVKRRAPLKLASLIDQADVQKKSEISRALRDLQAGSASQTRQHAGVLGRVAEFLLSQRGLSIW